MNELPVVVDHAQINMYANDIELHCCGVDLQNVQNDLQSDLCQVATGLATGKQTAI